MATELSEPQENFGSRASGTYFVARDTGRILFILRSEECHNPHTWSCVAGKTESGEAAKKSALREAGEEIGFKGPIQMTQLHVYKENGFQFTSFMGVVDKEFHPRLNWEADGFQWTQPGRWPKPLHPNSEEPLKKLQQLVAKLPVEASIVARLKDTTG